MTASGALVQDPSCVSPPPQLMVSVRGFAPEPAGVVANFKCIACVDISAPQPCSRSLSLYLYLGWSRGGSAADVAGASKLRNDDEPRRVITVRMMEIARAEYVAIPAGAPSRRAAEVATIAAKNLRPEGTTPLKALADSGIREDANEHGGARQSDELTAHVDGLGRVTQCSVSRSAPGRSICEASRAFRRRSQATGYYIRYGALAWTFWPPIWTFGRQYRRSAFVTPDNGRR